MHIYLYIIIHTYMNIKNHGGCLKNIGNYVYLDKIKLNDQFGTIP